MGLWPESDATEATWHACRKQPVAALKARNEEAVIPEKELVCSRSELVSSKTGFFPLLQHFFLTYKFYYSPPKTCNICKRICIAFVQWYNDVESHGQVQLDNNISTGFLHLSVLGDII